MFFLFVQVPTVGGVGMPLWTMGLLALDAPPQQTSQKKRSHPVHSGKNAVLAGDKDLSQPQASTRQPGG